jgi:hypothetical protein
MLSHVIKAITDKGFRVDHTHTVHEPAPSTHAPALPTHVPAPSTHAPTHTTHAPTSTHLTGQEDPLNTVTPDSMTVPLPGPHTREFVERLQRGVHGHSNERATTDASSNATTVRVPQYPGHGTNTPPFVGEIFAEKRTPSCAPSPEFQANETAWVTSRVQSGITSITVLGSQYLNNEWAYDIQYRVDGSTESQVSELRLRRRNIDPPQPPCIPDRGFTKNNVVKVTSLSGTRTALATVREFRFSNGEWVYVVAYHANDSTEQDVSERRLNGTQVSDRELEASRPVRYQLSLDHGGKPP